MDISERLTLWQKKYLSRVMTLPEETQLIYIIAMDAVYELTEQQEAFGKAIVEELRVNWACDTETALMILNGAERRMREK